MPRRLYGHGRDCCSGASSYDCLAPGGRIPSRSPVPGSFHPSGLYPSHSPRIWRTTGPHAATCQHSVTLFAAALSLYSQFGASAGSQALTSSHTSVLLAILAMASVSALATYAAVLRCLVTLYHYPVRQPCGPQRTRRIRCTIRSARSAVVMLIPTSSPARPCAR